MIDNSSSIRLNFADTFLESLQDLPPIIQARTFTAINRFMSTPDAVGRNLEKISNQMMSMRVDLSYRTILTEIESSKDYLLLWVDHHDAAYQWAERRKVLTTGNVIQVVQTKSGVNAVAKFEKTGIFSQYSTRHLRRLGVLEEQLPLLSSIESEDDLSQIANEIHPSVYEALCYLASGIPLDEIVEMMGIEEQPRDTLSLDFRTAINSDETKQTVVSINDELDLLQIQSMLEQPLEKWRLFLHASQRKLVESDFNGPAKIIGGAGTGKTIVAIHRAKYLAECIYLSSSDRILLTTFTANLSIEIEDLLRRVCQPSVMARIDVINVDKLVASLLNKNFPSYRIAYGDEIKHLWQKSIMQNQYIGQLSIDFLVEEWRRVAVPQKVKSLQEYLRADRTGRGIRLSRPEKAKVWSIFSTYLRLVDEIHVLDIDLATSMLTEALHQGKIHAPYTSIVVDEAQDFNRQTFEFLRAICGDHKNDMFIVGDAHQRIYRNMIRLSQCGIKTRGRSYTLRINYRTTEQIRRWAFKLFSSSFIDDLDEQEENGRGYISLLSGPEPEVVIFESMSDEIDRITQILEQLVPNRQYQQTICITVRTAQLLYMYKHALEEKGLRLYEIKSSKIDQQDIDGIRIATMHRVKGLEFDHVIMGAINDDVIPLKTAIRHAEDPISLNEVEKTERSLLYVAATRAKKTLHVFSHGKPSKFLDV